LYVGVTNDLEHRVMQHKAKQVAGFTARYNVNRLVWYETFTGVNDAIAAEKRIKSWRREKKVALIVEKNTAWRDLSLDFERQFHPEIPRGVPLGMTVAGEPLGGGVK
jgi:putative endonuclease